MGGGSYTGLEFKLTVESMLGWGDWLGVRGCGATEGELQEPSMNDCEDTGGGSVSPGWASPEDSCDDWLVTSREK